MKRMHLIILFFALTFSINFGQTNKAVPSGSGTEADPYQISSLANLSWLVQNSAEWGKHYIQTIDIDANETATWDDADDNSDGDLFNDANDLTTTGNNEGWLPIGNDAKLFSGIYNGDAFKIDGLSINRPTENHVALFGNVRTDFGAICLIKNLGLSLWPFVFW